jgi:hypothetical protein
MGGPPAWGLDVGLTTPHRKKKPVRNNLHKPRTWTDIYLSSSQKYCFKSTVAKFCNVYISLNGGSL